MRRMRVVLNAKAGTVHDMGPDKVRDIVDGALTRSDLDVDVVVAEGDAIEEGQPVVLLEAMKMENELRAIRGGIVKSVLVASGQRVDQNAPLLILE